MVNIKGLDDELNAELNAIKDRIESIDKERANVEKQWIKELKEATTKPKFDAYSKKGEKVIKKITNKFSPIFFELDSEREILVARNNEIVDEFEKKSKKNK